MNIDGCVIFYYCYSLLQLQHLFEETEQALYCTQQRLHTNQGMHAVWQSQTENEHYYARVSIARFDTLPTQV